MQMDYFGKGKKSSLRRISANLCSNTEKLFVHRESLRFFTSTYGKWEQEQDLKRIFLLSVIFLMDENRKYGKKIMYIFLCEFYHCTECKVTLQSVTISEMSSRRLSGIPKLKLQYKIEVIICYLFV